MEKFDSCTFKNIINNSGIAIMRIPVKEAMNYMPMEQKFEILYIQKLWNY